MFHLYNQMFDKKEIVIQISGMMESSVMITQHSIVNDKEQIVGIVSNSKLETKSQLISKMTFCIVNFLDFLGSVVKYGNLGYKGRTKLFYEQWEIIIDKRYDYSKKNRDVFGKLKSLAGYSITHIGCIQRIDQKAFMPEDVEHILKSVQWLLSFAAGRYVGICVLEGFNDGYQVWKKYQTPIMSNWYKQITWFPKQDSKSLEILFPLVLKKQEDPLWNKVLWEILWWYIEPQSKMFVEKKVVSVQVALETLSWVYLVEDGNVLSKTKYGNFSAAQRIKYLLSEFSIDVTIPESLNDYLFFDDGPSLFVTFRNDIVHPSRKPKFKENKTKLKILNLGIWYLEMAILGILGYQGKYVNRLKLPLWEGEYENVPWIIE